MQSNPRGAAYACSGNSFRGGVSPRFTRRPKGQSTVEYVLIIAIIVLVVLIAGPWVSSAIRSQFNTIAGAIGPGTTGENFYEPEDIPDPQNGTAFVVYSEDDHSLMFYKRRGVPDVGDMFNYRRVTAVYTGFETDMPSTSSPAPWKPVAGSIESTQVVDRGIAPRSMRKWFTDLINLKTCDLMRLDTSKVEDMTSTFAYCQSLTSIDLSSFDTSNVKDMVTMFSDCRSLKSLDISNFDTSKVSQMTGMFQNCESLISLDLSNFNTSNVKNMGWMFNHCKSLSSVNLSSFDTSNVSSMRTMFQGCLSLKTLNLSNFDTFNVTDMSFMFMNCRQLTSLDLSSFNTGKVSAFRRMFCNDESLRTLEMSNDETSNAADMETMFLNCKALVLDCSNWDVSSVTQHDGFSQDAPGVILPKAWQ